MSDVQPSDAEWRALFAAAQRVKELAPWQWMDESAVFGVENPATGEVGFVSVMGNLGEHLAVALYLGPDGLYNFLTIESQDYDLPPESILEVPQLQVSFEDRDILTTQDRNLIKRLGLKFRGRQSWPWFRSFAPGMFPWYLTAAEARFLTIALDQLMDVAPRAKENEDLLVAPDEDAELFLVRVPQQRDGVLEWEDRLQKVPPPEPALIEILIDPNLADQVRRMKRGNAALEVEFSMLPSPVNDDSPRPYFPYMVMTLESNVGFILGADLIRPLPSFESMIAQIPNIVLTHVSRLQVRPAKIQVDSERLFVLLQGLGERTKLKFELVDYLPGIEAAKASMAAFMGGLGPEEE